MSKIAKIRDESRDAFITIIAKSWTFNLLTTGQKDDCIRELKNAPLYGTSKRHFWDILHAVYRAYLHGAGYNDPLRFAI